MKVKTDNTLLPCKGKNHCATNLLFTALHLTKQLPKYDINVWTEPLRLNLLGPGNGHVTYLGRFSEPIPKNSL